MKEPLSLPRGSVRALLAIAAVGTTMYLFATGQQVPGELLIITGTVTTFYFIERARENTAHPPEEELAAPALAEGEDA